MKTVVCLMGPTATGKTDLAIKLAKKFPLELISVDSAMIYKGMDIGSAKPKQFHHLINIRNPDQTYSVGNFCKDAVRIIKDIHARKKIPLLVGGTMMYFRALQQGLSELPNADQAIRKMIRELENPYEKLSEVDPITAKRLHPNDMQRIERALEVYEITGIPLSEFHQTQTRYLDNYNVISIALIPSDREKLKLRIQKRFQKMLKRGLVGEVKKLLTYKDYPAMRSVGYIETMEYLLKKINRKTMIEKATIATQQLAKRQLVWLRSWPDLTVFEPGEKNLTADVSRLLQRYIEQLKKSSPH
ncbi:MAG: tRNA (adenosine(37)-N6)-dimethylallyltransferase MiaA [Gammaproteobacteria bacterium]|nr:tRNA (adenosine(37)-N6)-dimethylallyltransferase MiaA [Gammaproteobacteria bacterium]